MIHDQCPFTEEDIKRINQTELRKVIEQVKKDMNGPFAGILHTKEEYEKEIAYLSQFLKEE